MKTGTKIIIVAGSLAVLGAAAYLLLKTKQAATLPPGTPDDDAPGAGSVDNILPSASTSTPASTAPKGSSVQNSTPATQWPSEPQGEYEPGYPLKVGSKGAAVMKLNMKLGGVRDAKPVPPQFSTYSQNAGGMALQNLSNSFSVISPNFTLETERRLFAKYGITQINSPTHLASLGK